MKRSITYWIESDGKYLGFLNEFPDHWTQGDDFDDLQEHLKDLFKEFTKNDIPGIRKVTEIEIE